MGDRPRGDFPAAAAHHKSMLHTSLGGLNYTKLISNYIYKFTIYL